MVDSFESFLGQFKSVSYQAHQLIIQADEVSSAVFYIRKGFVRSYVVTIDGREFTAVIYQKGSFFPFAGQFNLQSTNAHYYEAMTSVTLIRIKKDRLLTFYKQNPEVLLEAAAELAVRFSGLQTRMEHLVLSDASTKVASIILICVERFGKKSSQGILIPVPLRHRDIASLVGISRETASIELKKLERLGIIQKRRGFINVNDVGKLRKNSKLDQKEIQSSF